MKRKLLLAVFALIATVSLCSWSRADRNAVMAVPYYSSKQTSDIKGSAFIKSLEKGKVPFWEMDSLIVEEILKGNVPEELRKFRKVTYKTEVDKSVPVLSKSHKVELWVLPDYLSVGDSKDFVRMPMSPIAAQQVADALGCSLPTTYLVDRINDAAEGAIEVFPFHPFGNRNSRPFCFMDSNNAINALFQAKGYHFGQFISGLKKDLVLTTSMERSQKYHNCVAIYGWHQPDGKPVQPLFIRHANFYSDYSHGIRMIWRKVKIDGKEYDLRQLMEDPELFRLVSDEDFSFEHASFDYQTPGDNRRYNYFASL